MYNDNDKELNEEYINYCLSKSKKAVTKRRQKKEDRQASLLVTLPDKLHEDIDKWSEIINTMPKEIRFIQEIYIDDEKKEETKRPVGRPRKEKAVNENKRPVGRPRLSDEEREARRRELMRQQAEFRRKQIVECDKCFNNVCYYDLRKHQQTDKCKTLHETVKKAFAKVHKAPGTEALWGIEPTTN